MLLIWVFFFIWNKILQLISDLPKILFVDKGNPYLVKIPSSMPL